MDSYLNAQSLWVLCLPSLKAILSGYLHFIYHMLLTLSILQSLLRGYKMLVWEDLYNGSSHTCQEENSLLYGMSWVILVPLHMGYPKVQSWVPCLVCCVAKQILAETFVLLLCRISNFSACSNCFFWSIRLIFKNHNKIFENCHEFLKKYEKSKHFQKFS